MFLIVFHTWFIHFLCEKLLKLHFNELMFRENILECINISYNVDLRMKLHQVDIFCQAQVARYISIVHEKYFSWDNYVYDIITHIIEPFLFTSMIHQSKILIFLKSHRDLYDFLWISKNTCFTVIIEWF